MGCPLGSSQTAYPTNFRFSCLFLCEIKSIRPRRRRFRQISEYACVYHSRMRSQSSDARLHAPRLRPAPGLVSRAHRRTDGISRPPLRPDDDTTLATPGALALRHLANRLALAAPHDGAFQLRLPGTWAIRLSRTTTQASYATLGPALCVAAQGAKVVMLGTDVLEYDPAHMLVLAVGLPISTQV